MTKSEACHWSTKQKSISKQQRLLFRKKGDKFQFQSGVKIRVPSSLTDFYQINVKRIPKHLPIKHHLIGIKHHLIGTMDMDVSV
jgi:hypothetical protein